MRAPKETDINFLPTQTHILCINHMCATIIISRWQITTIIINKQGILN